MKNDVLAFAYYCGAEAKANGKRHISAADRSDISEKAGYKSWNDIPQGMKNEVLDAWNAGWRNE